MNQKGITLTEVLVSMVLISIVMLFLFRLLVLLRNDDSLNEAKSNVLLVEDAIVNDIQDDIFGLGVQYVYGTNTQCVSNDNTDCCCTTIGSSNCIKVFYKSGIVKEVSIYKIDNLNDSIKYGFTNQKLITGLSFGTPIISRTGTYSGKYRYDMLSIIKIPVNGLPNNYSINIIAPSVYEDGASARTKCS